jgi:hypothetical protein
MWCLCTFAAACMPFGYLSSFRYQSCLSSLLRLLYSWFMFSVYRFSWGAPRTLGKLLSTLALLQVCHTATPNLMSAQREGNLRRQEEGGTAGASRFKLRQCCTLVSYCSYFQINMSVSMPDQCLGVKILCHGISETIKFCLFNFYAPKVWADCQFAFSYHYVPVTTSWRRMCFRRYIFVCLQCWFDWESETVLDADLRSMSLLVSIQRVCELSRKEITNGFLLMLFSLWNCSHIAIRCFVLAEH